MYRYFVIYKPYKMLSQFVSPYNLRTLKELDFDFPEGTGAVGRLDYESEGLLILTTDPRLTRLLLLPERQHQRNYSVKVQKTVTEETRQRLSAGINIFVKRKEGAYTTKPCIVNIIEKPANLPPREDELPERIAHSWLEFILTEGKNRQVRKMCRIVGHKCWRLIRTKIQNLSLGNMQPGEVKEIPQKELFSLLLLHPEETSQAE